MATIAIMIGTAIAFSAANLGAHYLQRAIDGTGNPNEERERHDRALEKYQKDMGEWEKQRTKLRDWEEHREIALQKARQDLHQGDEALTLYARTHPPPHIGTKPEWNQYYKPSKRHNTIELAVVGVGTLGTAYAVSKFF